MRKHRTQEIVILYHKDCFDGFAGAWTAWKKFRSKATYVGLEHQEDPPKGLQGKELYFIDFTYSAEVMRSIRKKAIRITILDHHKSHESATRAADDYRYSVTQSGCMLSWHFFHPQKEPPYLLRIIQDHDLFTHRIANTREYISYIAAQDFTFTAYDMLAKNFETAIRRKEILKLGKLLRRADQRVIERTLPNATPVLFEGIRTLAINSPIFYSDLANVLYSKRNAPFGISWYFEKGKLHVSLRSDGRVDVSKLAMKYGGGGHQGAAGFSLSIKNGFPWKFL